MCKTIAKAVTAVGLFLLVFLLSDLLGKNLYQWLEREHTELLYQYATDGQFSENIYFSEETDKRFGVPGSLPGLVEEKSLSGIADYLTKEQWEMAEILEDNTAYLEYLQQQGTSLSGLFNFSERFAGLRDGLTYACRYLLFLLWLVALHFLMRCRPALYFAMGLLCIFATCIKLSGKLPSVVLLGSPIHHLIADGLVPPLLESMLTFLIFDITITALEKVRLSRKLEPLYQDLPALHCLAVRLAQNTDSVSLYRSDLSRLLPHFSAYLQSGKRTRKKAKRLNQAIECLSGPHTNRSFLEAVVELQTVLPDR